jgi:hypothetical protein
VNREHWIEEMRESNTVRFGNKAEERTITVKAPWPAGFNDLEARLIVPVQNFVRHTTVRPAIHQGQSV